MVPFARLFLRFLVIGIGFFLAALAAGAAYIFLVRIVRPEDFGRVDDLELTVTLLVGTIGVASLFARAALLPAFALIAAFELFRLRDWLSHALAGGGLGLVLGLVRMGAGFPVTAHLLAVYAATGVLAALCYWLVAGRNAGRWLPSERQAAAESGSARPGS